MFYADQLRKDQLRFSLAVLEGARLQPPAKLQPQTPIATRELRHRELNLSGSQVLVGLMSGLGSVGLLVWAVVRLWLFGG